MNVLAYKKDLNGVGSRDTYKGEFTELEVDGAKELSVLCPVSKLTGFPMSMQQAITMISDKNSRLADVLMQEIPQIPQSDKLSDDEKLEMLVSRLDTGSFFENDCAMEILGDIAKEFFPKADVDKVVADKEGIDFKPSDAPSGDA